MSPEHSPAPRKLLSRRWKAPADYSVDCSERKKRRSREPVETQPAASLLSRCPVLHRFAHVIDDLQPIGQLQIEELHSHAIVARVAYDDSHLRPLIRHRRESVLQVDQSP